MQRRSGGGQTTASRIKSLLSYVQAEHGRAQADAFLLNTKLDRDYLEDETRLVPVELWHSALVAFASRFGREAVLRTSRHIVGAENLGSWAHVLRGTADPAGAYRQLELLGGEQGRTERWRTLGSGPTWWRGSIRVRQDSPEESDGLCSLARQAELASVPLLFGLPEGKVRKVPSSEGATGPASDAEEFLVTWRTPNVWPVGLGLAGGGALGLWTAQASNVLEVPFGGAAGVAIGLGLGLLGQHEWRRRTQSRAHLVRIHALERSQTLREVRERGTAGFQEGLVVAGQYRLTEKLGVGANGTIWEAERLSDGSLVAVKLLRAAVAHDTVAADRLRREAEALGLAWHPNVVEVYEDGYLPDGTCFLVMERLHGESLATRLHRVGALPPSTLLPMALQICDALGAVHAAGIVHRDLKPSNIFLEQVQSEQGVMTDHVKLLDFGVARVEWAETRLTNANSPLGTQGYMSPEQEQGLEIDHRSDIFAFGSVIYECLTGEPPPLSPGSLWTGERGGPESGVHRATPDIPHDWTRLIRRAMSPVPQHRFADSRAMREALARLGAKPPESASA
ncbi:MAG TPA: serine/threonine-protein kinase [Polyangiaceae bacterium]|nr:serine/threonine-protein kinase [Polyangiaceae bacterium]